MKSLQFGSTFFLSFFSIFCCLEFGETQLVVIVNHHHPLCRFRSRSFFFSIKVESRGRRNQDFLESNHAGRWQWRYYCYLSFLSLSLPSVSGCLHLRMAFKFLLQKSYRVSRDDLDPFHSAVVKSFLSCENKAR